MIRKTQRNAKLKEALDSVLPIALIVSVLCFFLVPVTRGEYCPTPVSTL